MRNLLVDSQKRRRRTPGEPEETLPDELVEAYRSRAGDLIDLHEALARLGRSEPLLEKVVELRFFAGLSAQQAAKVLGISKSTVDRMWRAARAWLRKELSCPET